MADKNTNEQQKFTVNFMSGLANSLVAAGVLTPVVSRAITGNALDGWSALVVIFCIGLALLLYLGANNIAGSIER